MPLFLYVLIALWLCWAISLTTPAISAVKASWSVRAQHPKLLKASCSLLVFNLVLTPFLVWYIIFSEPWDTNGIVVLFSFFFIPLLPLMVVLPIAYLIKHYGNKTGAWKL